MKLLEPLSRGRLSTKNRVVITSYAAYHHLYQPGASIDWYVEHIRRRGEVGLFVLQCEFPRFVGIDPVRDVDHLVRTFTRLGSAAHESDTKVLLQLAHQGVQSTGLANPDMRAIQAFTSRPSEMAPDVAHEMDGDELSALVEGFGELAEIATAAHLDGVELHAGHGHLLHQSMSRWANSRTDEWGEPGYFVTKVAGRVRAAVGNGVVGIRFPSNDHRSASEGGSDPQDLRRQAVELASTGLIDYLNPVEGSKYAHYGISVGTFRRPHVDFLAGTRAMTEALDGLVPVIGVGRIVTVDEAEEALEDGSCDLVAMTRAHIADPELLTKLRRGDTARIRRCVGANQGCLDRAHSGFPLTCFQNPEVGREHRVPAAPATTAKRVVVVGAGPAGLKAAEVAARRGHDVMLVEAGDRLGGRLAAITDVTGAGELVTAVEWIEHELSHLGVDVRTGLRADARSLSEWQPDVIVLATGSATGPAPFPSDESIPLLSTDEALERLLGAQGRSVMVYDTLGNEEAFVTYEQLASVGAKVTIATPLPNLGTFLGHTHAVDVVDRVLQLGCAVLERTRIIEVGDGCVTTEERLSGRRAVHHGFDAIVMATARVPNTTLVAAARDIAASVHVIGDAYSPRSAMFAIREGDNVGRAI